MSTETETETTTETPETQAPDSPGFSIVTRRRDLTAIGKLLGPLLVVFIIGLHFREFVANSILANTEINGLIIATILYGTGLILARFLNAHRDFMLIEYFGDQALAGRPMLEIIEDPRIKQRYIRHYFKHIAAMETSASGEDNRHALESELHALSEEYSSKLELPQFLVGFMIALGLLGTFIGLLSTLTGISTMLDGMGGATGGAMDSQFVKLVGQLRQPLAGMGIAFSASMFGLVGSLVLSIMMINLRRYISRVIHAARNTMHDIVEMNHHLGLTKPAAARATGMVMVAQPVQAAAPAHVAPPVVQEVVPPSPLPSSPHASSFSAEVESAMMLLAGRVDVLAGRLEALAQAMESTATGTKRLNESLGFGPRMKEVAELSHEQLKTLVDEQMQARNEMGRRFSTILEKISNMSEANIASGQHLWDIREAFSKLSSAMAAQETQAASVGQQTLLLEALLNETRQTRQWLSQIAGTGR